MNILLHSWRTLQVAWLRCASQLLGREHLFIMSTWSNADSITDMLEPVPWLRNHIWKNSALLWQDSWSYTRSHSTAVATLECVWWCPNRPPLLCSWVNYWLAATMVPCEWQLVWWRGWGIPRCFLVAVSMYLYTYPDPHQNQKNHPALYDDRTGLAAWCKNTRIIAAQIMEVSVS